MKKKTADSDILRFFYKKCLESLSVCNYIEETI